MNSSDTSYNIHNLDDINDDIKKEYEGLDILVVSYGGSCSNVLANQLEKNGYKCKTKLWTKILCHCPTYIDINIPIFYIYDNPIKSFLSQRKRGSGIWDVNQKKLSNNRNIELSDENLLRLMINQFNSWTNVKSDNVLFIKANEIFEDGIVNKLEKKLKKKISHFPIEYKQPNVTHENVKNFKSTELFKKYKLEIENIIKFTLIYEIKNFDYNNFEIYATDFNNLIPHSDKNRDNTFWVYDKKESCINIWDTLDVNICKNHELIDNSNIKKQKYRCLCNNKSIKLPFGIRSKHLYKDDNYIIYNERDNEGQLFKYNGNGRLISKTNKTGYLATIFDIHNNNTTNGGSEDYRYIIFNEDLYIIMNGLSKNSNISQMYLYNIKKNEICQLYIKNYNVKNINQKNWTPYIYKNELYFIYSLCELCVVKLKNGKTGECELVYGNPSLFTNKTIFGGTNLCSWKNDLFIGFAHIRNPWYGVPIIFDAKNYKYITTTIPIIIKTPFEIDLLKYKIVQYPYNFTKCQDKYELSVCHQDFYSIKNELSIDKVDSLFTSLLNYRYNEIL